MSDLTQFIGKRRNGEETNWFYCFFVGVVMMGRAYQVTTLVRCVVCGDDVSVLLSSVGDDVRCADVLDGLTSWVGIHRLP